MGYMLEALAQQLLCKAGGRYVVDIQAYKGITAVRVAVAPDGGCGRNGNLSISPSPRVDPHGVRGAQQSAGAVP